MAHTVRRSLAYACSCFCTMLVACGGGGGDTAASPSTPQRPVQQSDIEIAQSLYADTARTPSGFYAETSAPIELVATKHVKSADVTGGGVPQYELCSDDWYQAYNWSEQTAQASSQYGALVATDNTDRFYEFTRQRATQPTGVLRDRVYRCSYLDRGSVDLRATYTHAGQLNRRPISATDLKELTEYLWLFTVYNNYGNAVLKSDGAMANGNLQHWLTIASFAPTGGTAACGRIDVWNWTHSVDTQSGELTLSTTPLWSFNAKRTNGVVELCSN